MSTAEPRWIIGVSMAAREVTGVVAAPPGVRASAVPPVQWTLVDSEVETVVQTVTGLAQRLAEDVPTSERAHVELAVAVPGHIDAAGQTVVRSTDYRDGDVHWADVELAALLGARAGLPTSLVNDANALAIQEHHFGGARGVDDFALVYVAEHGVGCGLIVGGRLALGSRGSAGEVGHLRVGGSSNPCRCGGTGCLERVVSGGAIQARLHDLSDREQAPTALLTDVGVLEHAGKSLGDGLLGVVDLLNPSLIIVHGPDWLVDAGTEPGQSVFVRALQTVVHARGSSFSDAGVGCRIHASPFRAEDMASGAATYARHCRG